MFDFSKLEDNCEDLESPESDVVSEIEEEYEKRPRDASNQHEIRQLLPAKGKSGLIFRSEIVDHDVHTETPCNDKDDSDVGNKNETVPQNFIELCAYQQKNFQALKTKVGLLCSHIVEDPENNTRALKELIVMLQNDNTFMIISEKKLLALSLLHVFTDILPGYRIRDSGQDDKNVKLKKETRRLLDYELTLLRNYKKYLDCLHQMVNQMKGKHGQRAGQQKAQHEIGLVAVKCLCELLTSKMNFNYQKNIANILVPLGAHRNHAVSACCCQAIEKLYRSDKLGEASLEVVKLICKLLKERKFSVPENLMRTFLHLNVQEANAKGSSSSNKKDMKKLRKQLNLMSRKERKHSKKTREVEKQLREAEAQESTENKSKFQTEVLQKVFWVYFHVIKDTQKFTMLSPVLEGLSKFAHLINLEFFDDLSIVLCGIMENEMLSDADKLHCMQTMFTILLGHAESLNIDPQKMYCHLYKILLNLQLNTPIGNYVLASKCVDLMIIKRKKKISVSRILAFVKRLCTVSLQAPLPGLLICLSLVRKIMMASNNAGILLDTEDTVGSGTFLPELEDPEHCNAHSSALWELQLLLSHSNPAVVLFARHVLHGCPIQGNYSIPVELSNMSPEELVSHFNIDSVCEEQNSKTYSKGAMPAKRRKLSAIGNSLICDTGDATWSNVKKANFVTDMLN